MRAKLTHRPGLTRRQARGSYYPRYTPQPIKDAGLKVARAWDAAMAMTKLMDEQPPNQLLLRCLRRS